MNQWANTVLTEKGVALLTKLTQGNTLGITRAITGSGFVTPGLLVKQTAVATPQQELSFHPTTYPEEGKCKITVFLTNDGLATGYSATQVGIFATDPDDGEVLFIIAQAQGEQSGTNIPSASEMPGYSAEWSFYFQYGQAENVNVTVDQTGTVTRAQMEEYVNFATQTKAGQVGKNGAEIFNDYKRNKAEGPYSHAEGEATTASGRGSHAEGSDTEASGPYSHAEGYGTTASGEYSHAEGENTTASGPYSHAEGSGTTASGPYSHAEGYNTKASDNYSHAEGSDTEASGDISHAEGEYTTASGRCSHAEGNDTEASGENSHAEGLDTTASGRNSHAEGGFTEASGDASHAEGRHTEASGDSSHAEGLETTASGENSHAEGRGTIAAGVDQHVYGSFNVVDNDDKYVHIIGNGESDSERSNAHTLDWDGNAWYAGAINVGDPATSRENLGAAPAYTYGTADLTAGVSELETGKLYFVYE